MQEQAKDGANVLLSARNFRSFSSGSVDLMSRPLAGHSVDALEKLLRSSRDNKELLQGLLDELQHRSTKKAQQLQQQVAEALRMLRSAPVRIEKAVSIPAQTEGPAAAHSAGMIEMTTPDDQPHCPQCGAAMVRRVAKRGSNVGGEFWGCSNFPTCKTALSIDAVSLPGTDTTPKPATPPAERGLPFMPMPTVGTPVPWSDARSRAAWVSEYVAIAALPGVLKDCPSLAASAVTRALGQSLFLTRRDRPRQPSNQARLAAALLSKLLMRGHAPLVSYNAEGNALEQHALMADVVELSSTGPEIGWQLRPGHLLPSEGELLACLSRRRPFILDSEFFLDGDRGSALLASPEERRFLLEWVPQRLGIDVGHWITPQASLDRLLEAHGLSGEGARRVDFLFCAPSLPSFAVEIDGPEHDPIEDQERDRLLQSIGIEVIRISNAEIAAGQGAGLSRAETLWNGVQHLHADQKESKLTAVLLDCAEAAKVQLAVARALGYGWLPSNAAWHVRLDQASQTAVTAFLDAVDLVRGYDALYGCRCAPDQVLISHGDNGLIADWAESGWILREESLFTPAHLTIRIERDAGPMHETAGLDADILIRPAYLSIEFAAETTFALGRQKIIAGHLDKVLPHLTNFLRQIFRKKAFRPLQAEAIFNCLRGNDSVVLLPTGAGKSFIYQLSGLLLPGVTLVIDPIVSLIEDQVDGLSQYGIDRAVPVTSFLVGGDERQRLMLAIERGQYLFILHSPERLQAPEFRSALRALAQSSLINLAVVDEAHCVSEWGHQFRPAYLNLGENVRKYGADGAGAPPPILALTGTASRAVLRDVLAELKIDRSRSDALIRPDSFDRRELTFQIVRTRPGSQEKAALHGILIALPNHFGYPAQEFFQPCGRRTNSGLVFVPFVNGAVYGVTRVASEVRGVTNTQVAVYSGSAPKGQEKNWEFEKRRNVRRYKGNEVPILVSTKAFGMGIDKPNIRYTVHFGMPGSLEAFYQEAGRAGRDRQPARCSVVFSEFDPERSDHLLDPTLDLQDVRARHAELAKDRTQDDDVTRALWFHLNAFGGEEEEVEDVRRVLLAFPVHLDQRTRLKLPFWADDENSKRQEKALFRLVKVGIVSDYEVLFGSRVYVVDVEKLDLDACRAQLLQYTDYAQPGRSKVFARALDKINGSNPQEVAVALTRELIHFTYNVIERSRRRSIQEAFLLARTANSDLEIRQRLLDYLQEGLGAEQLEKLVEEREVRLVDWCEMFGKIYTPVDAGEVRGLVIRALESFPDHPGLLLVRGVTEIMSSDSNETVAGQAIYTAFRKSSEDYQLEEHCVAQTIDILFDLAESRAPQLGLPLAWNLSKLCEEQILSVVVWQQICAALSISPLPQLHLIPAIHSCIKSARDSVTLGERFLRRWSPDCLSKLM